jgi:hypothetical protein
MLETAARIRVVSACIYENPAPNLCKHITHEGTERMSVVGIARQHLGVERIARRERGIGDDDRGFDADLWTTPAFQQEPTTG